MTIYLVSNNLVLEDIKYETDEAVEEKRITRPLSIDGEKEAVKLVKKIDANVIYSSNYASALATAKYYASYKKLDININSFLNYFKVAIYDLEHFSERSSRCLNVSFKHAKCLALF